MATFAIYLVGNILLSGIRIWPTIVIGIFFAFAAMMLYTGRELARTGPKNIWSLTLLASVVAGLLSFTFLVDYGGGSSLESLFVALFFTWFLPWLVVFRRAVWTWRGKSNLAWNRTNYVVFALSLGALPLGYFLGLLVAGLTSNPGQQLDGLGTAIVILVFLSFSYAGGVVLAYLTFVIQLIRDRWHPVLLAILTVAHITEWLIIAPRL